MLFPSENEIGLVLDTERLWMEFCEDEEGGRSLYITSAESYPITLRILIPSGSGDSDIEYFIKKLRETVEKRDVKKLSDDSPCHLAFDPTEWPGGTEKLQRMRR